MKPFLMGTETEYAVSGRNGTAVMGPEEAFRFLNEALRQERRWLPDAAGGWAAYFEHGGRIYMDSGGHPEHATPECSTPTEVALYDKAGERLFDLARERVQRERPGLTVSVLKNNVGPIHTDEATWGCHESYTSWVRGDKAGEQLVPHVVSRLIYAGAGCLSGRTGCAGFELSQRARHLRTVIGTDTTSNRPIFCTRLRKASDHGAGNWTRAHLIAKDSQRAPFGTYLTFGTTGLLFVLVNAGRRVGQGLALADPVRAAQTISCDPWLRARVPLADGRTLTALEIQEAYLEECARGVQSGGFPEWAPEVIGHWGTTLHQLHADPLRLADRLDPYCKLLVFGHELQRAGHTWAELHGSLAALTRLRERYTPDVIRALLAEAPGSLPTEARVHHAAAVLEAKANQPGVLDRLRFAVRLQALELNYHELGGLYDWLAAAGQLRSVVLTRDDVERATHEAPPGGRAATRAEYVKTSAADGWLCDWRYLYHAASKTFVDMRNPFVAECKIEQVENLATKRRDDRELREVLAQLSDD
ncbi:MAG TPA: proteasome accessory factor PafA2 family protein [Gemmataceae bacterium]|nr:proteasome accessory factor PafA2 family protein [Gemmataceae bacterium]